MGLLESESESKQEQKIVDRTTRRTIVNTNHAFDMSEETAPQVAGTTLPMGSIFKSPDEKGCDYDPIQNRDLTHPTTDWETLAHLLKGSLGSGILAMPLAFSNAGLWYGLVSTIVIGVICTYCVHILVKCSHTLCRRTQVSSLSYAKIAETAFLTGPETMHKWSGVAKVTISTFLVLVLMGCCSLYVVFVATNAKQLVDFYFEVEMEVRLVMLCLLLPLILLCLVRNLKYLAPFSMIANGLFATGIACTMYYIFQDLPATSSRPAIEEVQRWPMFFGTAIFALEAIGVVISLENNMKTPQNFIGCPGVLNTGMAFVVILYAIVGFFGFLKYGAETKGSITLNLPVDDLLAQFVKLMIAIAIFLTYPLQFYVPMGIISNAIKGQSPTLRDRTEYFIRIGLVVLTVLVAILIPNLGPFLSLIGAVCVSNLGLIFPSVIELVTYWESPGMGKYNWRLWKNACLILFGILGFFSGTYVSILEIKEEYQ